MILQALRYSFVQAKTKGLKGRLLKESDWHYLLMARDLKEILRYLTGTVYAPYLASLKTSHFHDLVTKLYEALFKDYERLLKIAPRCGVSLLKALLRGYEAENLKLVIRALFWQKTTQARELLYPLKGLNDLDFQDLLKTGTIANLIERLRGTYFYRPLKRAWPLFKAQARPFPLEKALDMAALEALVESLKALRRTDRIRSQRLIGLLIDKENLVSICRLKYIYHLSPEEIIGYLTYPGGLLKLKTLGALTRASELKDFINFLPSCYR
ncbi:V-type ATPase subunit [Thermosulfuriphilus sp.]